MAQSLIGDTSHLFIEFKADQKENPQKSKEAGRPIFDDWELCSIQHVGDQKTWSFFPAHERSIYIKEGGGSGRYVTYAECYYEHYKAFKEGQARAQSGTPIEELPFLSGARRAELKALNIHTAEALAGLDGTPLTRLGMGGREMKTQAEAYLARAKEGALEARLAAKNAALEAEIEKMREQLANVIERQARPGNEGAANGKEAGEPASAFEAWADHDLREFVKEKTGNYVKGHPSHRTLVAMAEQASAIAAGPAG